MSKAVQYYSNGAWSQFALTDEDLTLPQGWSGGGDTIANYFMGLKDKNDNLYLVCLMNGLTAGFGKIIKITANGTKYISKLNWDYSARTDNGWAIGISKDQSNLIIATNWTSNDPSTKETLFIPTNFESVPIITKPTSSFLCTSFVIYQDRYIWTVLGSTVKIYDYNTKAELASKTGTNLNVNCICCNIDNVLYVYNGGYTTGTIRKYTHDGASTITETYLASINYNNAKQMLIDKWGDLLVLYNTGSIFALRKYSNSGVQIGDTISFAQAMYNLNLDGDGCIYYSNNLGTYKVPATTAQGQAIPAVGTHVKIRSTGMTSYGNDFTGYTSSKWSSVGCE